MQKKQESNLGKKVFFLYPHSVIQDRLLARIFEQEYEVYLLKDHEKALRILRHFNDSILFINIDEVLNEGEWEEYIRKIKDSETTRNVRIGVMTYNENRELMEKYSKKLKIRCGAIRLKIGSDESTRIVLESLETNEARGRRKYVRTTCTSSHKATFNVRLYEKIYSGSILNISSAGMACSFNDPIKLEPGTLLEDIQIRLSGSVCPVFKGRVAGSMGAAAFSYVIMYEKDIDRQTTNKIRSFIFSSLQQEVDRIANSL